MQKPGIRLRTQLYKKGDTWFMSSLNLEKHALKIVGVRLFREKNFRSFKNTFNQVKRKQCFMAFLTCLSG